MSVDFFEEGKKRRFMSCDKAEEELFRLSEVESYGSYEADAEIFWSGYRWHEPEVKQKANKNKA
jgi:hypothetical protein